MKNKKSIPKPLIDEFKDTHKFVDIKVDMTINKPDQTVQVFYNNNDVEKFIKESKKPLTIIEAKRRLHQDIQEAKKVIKKEFPRIDIDKWATEVNKPIKSIVTWCNMKFKKT